MAIHRLLADTLVLLHALFVAFVLVSLPAALVGRRRRWHWTRNFWFRMGHLASILFVILLTWAGRACPLTVWENRLRERAGQASYPGDFIGYWIHRLLFYEFPPWVFTLAYTLFGIAVAAAFFIAPPRWPNRKS